MLSNDTVNVSTPRAQSSKLSCKGVITKDYCKALISVMNDTFLISCPFFREAE